MLDGKSVNEIMQAESEIAQAFAVRAQQQPGDAPQTPEEVRARAAWLVQLLLDGVALALAAQEYAAADRLREMAEQMQERYCFDLLEILTAGER